MRGPTFFLGMAIVFSAVGAVTQMSAGASDSGFEGTEAVQINTSASLKSADKLRVGETSSMKFGDEDELLSTIEVDPSSTSQNFYTALRLLLQAFRTVPVFTYISFALSLVFLLLYLNPVGYLVAAV